MVSKAAARTRVRRTSGPAGGAEQPTGITGTFGARTEPGRRAGGKQAAAARTKKQAVAKSKTAAKPGAKGGVRQEPVAGQQSQAAGTRRTAAGRAGAGGARKAVAVRPRDLVQRVYKTIDLELTKLEKQKGASSQDRERASRALSQMVNSLEKAVDMQRELLRQSPTRSPAKDKEALRHAEDLRREIADRLERLNRKRRDGGGAAGTDGA
jgi:hypothetical protein